MKDAKTFINHFINLYRKHSKGGQFDINTYVAIRIGNMVERIPIERISTLDGEDIYIEINSPTFNESVAFLEREWNEKNTQDQL